MHKVIVLSEKELKKHSYAIIGTGGFTEKLLSIISNMRVNSPVVFDAAMPELAKNAPEYLILGTDTFQLEIINRWGKHLSDKQKFIDVSDIVWSKLDGFNLNINDRHGTADILFCGMTPALSENKWLKQVRAEFQRAGLSWRYLHPLEAEQEYLLKKAKSVLIWNGSQPIFADFLNRCKSYNVPITYVECGFFPQKEHFYFDKFGVNLASQLASDPMHWLTDIDFKRVEDYKKKLFGRRVNRDNGYIFVPLQIASDSNIQNNSRFKNGMQEYIDFIHDVHPLNKVIFKVHPKDNAGSKYRFYQSKKSDADTLDLISGASLVRGINSSVLFESVLFGKEICMDGQSLLNQDKVNPSKIIAAMLARQYRVDEFSLSREKLMRFSNLGNLFYD